MSKLENQVAVVSLDKLEKALSAYESVGRMDLSAIVFQIFAVACVDKEDQKKMLNCAFAAGSVVNDINNNLFLEHVKISKLPEEDINAIYKSFMESNRAKAN